MVKLGRELICLIFLGLATLVSSSTPPNETNQTSSSPASSSSSATPLTFAMPLINYYNSEYSGQIVIGADGQSVNLAFDTGAVWILVDNSSIPSQSTSNCSSSSSCNLLGFGDVEKTTFKYITYGETVGGYIVSDSFVLNNETLINQTLLLPDTSSPKWNKYSDGVCGLSLTNGKNPTLLDNLAKKNIITNKMFGLYLSNNPEAYGETTSEIMFGGSNPNYYTGNFTNVSLIADTPYWQIPLEGILFSNSIQSSSFQLNADTAIIASGIEYLLFSSDDFQTIIDSFTSTYQLSCSNIPGQELLNCDCPNGDISAFPNISIILDAQPLMIPPSLYLDITDQGCNVLIQGTLDNEQTSFEPAPSSGANGTNGTTNGTTTGNSSDDSTDASSVSDASDEDTIGLAVTQQGTYIILGAVFLRNFYTVFDADNKVISFAQVVNPPLGLISALQVIYIVLGAFIVILFIVFVGWFVRIMFSKKAPVAEVASPEKPLVERRTTTSQQIGHGFDG